MVWLREEPPIIHVCCRTEEDAIKLMNSARAIGFKRGGIIALGKNTVYEMASTEFVEAPVAKNCKTIVDDKYLKILIAEANKRLLRGKKKINKLSLSLYMFS